MTLFKKVIFFLYKILIPAILRYNIRKKNLKYSHKIFKFVVRNRLISLAKIN